MERMNRAPAINEARYRRLLSKAMPVVIESEEENDRMLAVVEKLMDKGENLSLEELRLLKLLTRLVEDFEERFYHPEEASPLEVLQHLMDARNIKQSDLLKVLGSKGV